MLPADALSLTPLQKPCSFYFRPSPFSAIKTSYGSKTTAIGNIIDRNFKRLIPFIHTEDHSAPSLNLLPPAARSFI
jgi:hypothetical protein